MKICENGIIRDMTAEEESQYNEMAARAAAEAKHRPISESEVMSMLIKEQINTLSVDDATAVRMVAFYPEWEKDKQYTVGYKAQYHGKLYKVVQAHTSQETWTPDSTGAAVEGTMVNQGAKKLTIDGLTKLSVTIPAGYHDGTGTVSLTDDILAALAAI